MFTNNRSTFRSRADLRLAEIGGIVPGNRIREKRDRTVGHLDEFGFRRHDARGGGRW